MDEFCTCEEGKNLINSYNLFKKEPPYGWILSWIEVTKEKGYSQLHRYGIRVKYCPMCGNKLENN